MARLGATKRKMLWSECGPTATKLHNMTKDNNGTPHERLFRSQPHYGQNLKIFGEIGIYKDNSKKKKKKLDNKGK